MAGQNLAEFYARAARIEQARAAGYGFEAEGSLGRSHYRKPQRRRVRPLGPVLVLILCFIALKVALLGQVGPAAYQARLGTMQAQGGLAALGATLMQVDPVTRWASAQAQALLR